MWGKLLSFFKATPVVVKALPEDVGLTILKHYEQCAKKLPNGMIGVYDDGVGVATIGWGSTQWQDGTRVKFSDKPITQAQADALLAFWHTKFRDQVAALLPLASPKRDVDVLTSLAYNIGISAFKTSTALRRYVGGQRSLCGDGIEMWNKGGGKVLKGLQRRRRAERLVFDGLEPKVAIAQAEKDFP